MQESIQESDLQHLCKVCNQTHDRLYSTAKCPHQFCQPCSLSYIASQVNNFSLPRCMEEECAAPLDKSASIYAYLDQQTLRKLKQLEIYKFLKDNPQYSSCKADDCSGVFFTSQGKCNQCSTIHCRNCKQINHEGQCSQQDVDHFSFNYRKCPSCRVWVEKAQGCRFIHCKCGTEFCYSCGSPFANDPCRKRQSWQKQIEIKQLMRDLTFGRFAGLKDILVPIPRVMMTLVVMTPITCLFGLVIALVLGLGVPVALFGPLGLCHMISEIECPRKRWASCVLLVIFYPVLSVIIIGGWTMMVLMYPCARNTNHHGFYDPFDKGLAVLAEYYLKLAGCMLNGYSS